MTKSCIFLHICTGKNGELQFHARWIKTPNFNVTPKWKIPAEWRNFRTSEDTILQILMTIYKAIKSGSPIQNTHSKCSAIKLKTQYDVISGQTTKTRLYRKRFKLNAFLEWKMTYSRPETLTDTQALSLYET